MRSRSRASATAIPRLPTRRTTPPCGSRPAPRRCLLAGLDLRLAGAPVPERDIDRGPAGRNEVVVRAVVLRHVVRVQDRTTQAQARIQRRARHASLAAARSTSASASRMSGRVRSRSAGTSPGRNRAGLRRRHRAPAGIRRVAAQQQRQRARRPVGRQAHRRQRGQGALPAHAGRVGVLRRAQAGVQPHLRQPLGLAVQLGHLRQQRDLTVGHAQVQIVAHHGRDHRHAQALLASGGQVGVRAGLQPAALGRAEQAQLPDHVDAGVEIGILGLGVLHRAGADPKPGR